MIARKTARPAFPPGHHGLLVSLVAGRGGGAGGLQRNRPARIFQIKGNALSL
jgi:hypothetical protein